MSTKQQKMNEARKLRKQKDKAYLNGVKFNLQEGNWLNILEVTLTEAIAEYSNIPCMADEVAKLKQIQAILNG